MLFLLEKYELDIENRVVIGFAFIKTFMYSQYNKLKNITNLNITFPVEYLKNGKKITLDEISNVFYYWEIKVINGMYIPRGTDGQIKYIRVMGDGIKSEEFYWNNGNKWTNSVIDKFNNFFESDMYFEYSEIPHKLTLKTDKPFSQIISAGEIFFSEESSKNLFIRILLNSYGINREHGRLSYDERLDRLLSNLSKLYDMGSRDYLSAYQKKYKRLKEIFKEKNMEDKRNHWKTMFEDYFKRKETKSTFLMGIPPYEEILRIINLLGTVEEKFEFLEILIEKNITEHNFRAINLSKCMLNKKTNVDLSNIILEKEIESASLKERETFVKNELEFLNKEFWIPTKHDNSKDVNENIDDIIISIENFIKDFDLYNKIDTISHLLDTQVKVLKKIKTVKESKKQASSMSSYSSKYEYQDLLDKYWKKTDDKIIEMLSEKTKKSEMTAGTAQSFYNKIITKRNEEGI